MEKIKEISKESKVRIIWETTPENYSRDEKNKIINLFSKKYDIDKKSINVQYKPVKLNSNGELVDMTGVGIESIMDINYQRLLMKEVLKRDNKNVDFERIIALDDKVNDELEIDLTATQHKKWNIKWITIDNFLSFGDNNHLPLDRLKGLTVVNSSPSNMGGKTTLTIDALKFLLYGNTTKTDKNEQIFNLYSGKNDLIVRGMIEIEGDETIIERKLKRSQKKSGEWNVTNKVNYYKILPDGEEKELNEEDAKKTTAKIKESVGNEKDFELLVLATEKNLDDLIGLTVSESGKVLTRLIGLEVLEIKEGIVRKMYNEFNSKKKSNQYDIITLQNEIEEHQNKVKEYKDINLELRDKLDNTKKEIESLDNKKDGLINSKQKIDVSISELNPSNLETEINNLTEKGKTIKDKCTNLKLKIDEIKDVVFDEDSHHLLTKRMNNLNSEKAVKESEIKRNSKTIQDLIEGGICKACNRKLDNVDNTEHIKKHEKDNELLTEDIKKLVSDISEIKLEIDKLSESKKIVDDRNKLELEHDRFDVELSSLRISVREKMNDLKKYKENLTIIENNKNIDIEISKVKTDLDVLNHSKDNLITKIERTSRDIDENFNGIGTKNKLIDAIKKEEEIDKIFRVYIELVGKKGISKLVLRSVLPLINSEVERLLDDICDFEIEVYIDDKNEVQFLMIKDEIKKPLKACSGFEKTAASLALRSVLGKISTLPMPNFITFDEVMGKVANENIEKLKPLFDKIKDMYDIVFLITHNDLVKDWADNVITVVKTDNISKLTLKN